MNLGFGSKILISKTAKLGGTLAFFFAVVYFLTGFCN